MHEESSPHLTPPNADVNANKSSDLNEDENTPYQKEIAEFYSLERQTVKFSNIEEMLKFEVFQISLKELQERMIKFNLNYQSAYSLYTYIVPSDCSLSINGENVKKANIYLLRLTTYTDQTIGFIELVYENNEKLYYVSFSELFINFLKQHGYQRRIDTTLERKQDQRISTFPDTWLRRSISRIYHPDTYRVYQALHSLTTKEILQVIKDAKPNLLVIAAACGEGRDLLEYKKQYNKPNLFLAGIDINSINIQNARELHQEHSEITYFERGDLVGLHEFIENALKHFNLARSDTTIVVTFFGILAATVSANGKTSLQYLQNATVGRSYVDIVAIGSFTPSDIYPHTAKASGLQVVKVLTPPDELKAHKSYIPIMIFAAYNADNPADKKKRVAAIIKRSNKNTADSNLNYLDLSLSYNPLLDLQWLFECEPEKIKDTKILDVSWAKITSLEVEPFFEIITKCFSDLISIYIDFNVQGVTEPLENLIKLLMLSKPNLTCYQRKDSIDSESLPFYKINKARNLFGFYQEIPYALLENQNRGLPGADCRIDGPPRCLTISRF